MENSPNGMQNHLKKKQPNNGQAQYVTICMNNLPFAKKVSEEEYLRKCVCSVYRGRGVYRPMPCQQYQRQWDDPLCSAYRGGGVFYLPMSYQQYQRQWDDPLCSAYRGGGVLPANALSTISDADG